MINNLILLLILILIYILFIVKVQNRKSALPKIRAKRKIIIRGLNYSLEFSVNFNKNFNSHFIIDNLPLVGKINKWGNELYFSTNINIPSQSQILTNDVNIGDIAYWPEDQCICIFYGETPASKNEKPMPISPVMLLGKTSAEPNLLKKVGVGDNIEII